MMIKKLKHVFFTKMAKVIVKGRSDKVDLVKPDKPMKQWRVAFLTTAGVHVKTQPGFDVNAGDHTFRLIPDDSLKEELMITHTHYDTTDADKDINCVFPIDILHELRDEGMIAVTAPNHYGLMGYIPNTKPLLDETIPKIIEKLKIDKVDVLLLSPG
jgi:D-proline reductase (dithiol) PrdB